MLTHKLTTYRHLDFIFILLSFTLYGLTDLHALLTMNSVVIQTLFSFSSFLILTIDLLCQTRSFEDSDSPGYPKENNTGYDTF